MAAIFPVIRRGISTTVVATGKKNFKKFNLFGKRGTKEFKERQRTNPDPEMPVYTRGVRETGIKIGDRFVEIPEKIPELIVPDLEKCELKPYASYRSTRVVQSEFTPQDLFNAIYAEKIRNDFEAGKLDEAGNPLEPSEYELMTPEQARDAASKTGCDLFTARHDKEGPSDMQ